MVDAAEIAVHDQIERLFAAIVRMHAPADIGKQASGVTQPAIVFGLLKFRNLDQSIGPLDQFLGMMRRT